MSLQRVAAVLRDAEGLEADALGGHHLEDVVERLRARAGLAVGAYADLVAGDSEARAALVAELLVHETSFFRYPASFRRLVTTALERKAARERSGERSGPVRVLCAACATGQEAYSVAIALLEAELSVRVDAFDRSSSAIEIARAGRYERGAARGLDAERAARWFQSVDGVWTASPALRAVVTFEPGDLLDERRPFAGGAYDTVFCRNLLIYLTEPARRRALAALREALAPGGVLYVGHAEVLVARAGGFARVDAASTYACVPVPEGAAAPARTPVPPPAPSPARATRAAVASASRPAPSRAAGAPPAPATDVDALEQARELADAGRLAEAVSRIEGELARGGPRADCFHLLALVHRAAGRTREADVALGRALYLDPEHVGALLLAAVAAEGRGETGAAARLKARARAALHGGVA